MAVMIQLRHVPEDLHRTLKARAAMAGMSLSDYLLNQVRRIAEQPTREELVERLAKLTPVESDLSSAEIIRELRDSR